MYGPVSSPRHLGPPRASTLGALTLLVAVSIEPKQVDGASWAWDWIALMDGVHERLARAFRVDAP